MKKWIIACAILTLALAGCSSSDESAQSTETPRTDLSSEELIDKVFNETNTPTEQSDTHSPTGELGTSGEQSNSEQNQTPTEQHYPVKETKHNDPNKMTIKDNSASDPSLEEFITELKKVVYARDAEALSQMLASNIKFSFGGDMGKENFISHWKLDQQPGQSAIWQELEEILVLGGDYSSSDIERYVMPYLFVHFPEKYDAYTSLGVIGENVNVREKPDIKSGIVTQLSYDYVKLNGEKTKETYKIDGRDYPWVPVITSAGQEGYIVEKFVRSPIDYRLSITQNEQAKWEINLFIAGD